VWFTAARSASVWRGGSEAAVRDRAVTLLQEVIRSGDEPEVVREAATALGRIGRGGDTVGVLFGAIARQGGSDRFLDHSLVYALIEIASNAANDAPLRLAALEVIAGRLPAPMNRGFFELALSCFEAEHPAQRRIAAAHVLAKAPLSPDQKLRCARELVPRAGPLELDPLLAMFEGGTASPTLHDVLAEALQDSPGLFSIASRRIESLFGPGNEAAEPILESFRSMESRREERLAELVERISRHEGDPERGKAAFVKGTCAVCHEAGASGGTIGPALTTIGDVRSERDLLEAIAFPSATFAREYEPWVVILKSGEVKLGRLGRETRETVELIDGQGVSHHLSTKDIRSREMASVSLMPPGLERLLSDVELADLIAFLKQHHGAE